MYSDCRRQERSLSVVVACQLKCILFSQPPGLKVDWQKADSD